MRPLRLFHELESDEGFGKSWYLASYLEWCGDGTGSIEDEDKGTGVGYGVSSGSGSSQYKGSTGYGIDWKSGRGDFPRQDESYGKGHAKGQTYK